MEELMKWAVRAAKTRVLVLKDSPEKAREMLWLKASHIQAEAESILAVVREVQVLMEAEGDITFVRINGGENKIGIAFANLRRAMPAALKAMEIADE